MVLRLWCKRPLHRQEKHQPFETAAEMLRFVVGRFDGHFLRDKNKNHTGRISKTLQFEWCWFQHNQSNTGQTRTTQHGEADNDPHGLPLLDQTKFQHHFTIDISVQKPGFCGERTRILWRKNPEFAENLRNGRSLKFSVSVPKLCSNDCFVHFFLL